MHGPFVPPDFRNDAGPTLPPARFIDTSGFGVVPFRVTNPGDPSPILRQAQDEAGGSRPTTSTPHGEPVEPRPTLDALRKTIEALTHEARWRGPPRDRPLAGRLAGRRTVAALNTAIASIAALLAADPPAARHAIHLAPVPADVLLALDDLRPALAMADRALRWLEKRAPLMRDARTPAAPLTAESRP